MGKKEFLLLITSISLTLVAFEAVLRFVNYPEPPTYGWSGLVPSTRLTDVKGSPEGTKIRILLLGDSQVGASSSQAGPLPGELLETALNSKANQFRDDATKCGTLPLSLAKYQIAPETLFEVDTLAAGGWGQDQELLNLRKLKKNKKYDLVLLWFTPENDIWNNAFPTHWPMNGAGKPTFVFDKNGQLRLASKNDITSRLLYSDYKLYTLLMRLINRVITLNGDKDSVAFIKPSLIAERFGWSVNADQYWYKNFISKYKTINHEMLQESSSPNTGLIRRQLNPLELGTINPYSPGDPVKYEKFHFAIAADPSSAGIKYMVDLTKALVAEIQLSALNSGSDFAAFWYDASKTLQPLYPKDGIYNINGTDVKIDSSVMLKRLNEIFAGTNHASIVLGTPEWRQPNNNPHLTTEANKILMQSIARCLKRASLLGWHDI